MLFDFYVYTRLYAIFQKNITSSPSLSKNILIHVWNLQCLMILVRNIPLENHKILQKSYQAACGFWAENTFIVLYLLWHVATFSNQKQSQNVFYDAAMVSHSVHMEFFNPDRWAHDALSVFKNSESFIHVWKCKSANTRSRISHKYQSKSQLTDYGVV